jgi:hypothetical protein
VRATTWAALELSYPVAYPRHLMIGHVTPEVVLAVVGAVFGRCLMRNGNE